jgi:anti-anti-sigma factor
LDLVFTPVGGCQGVAMSRFSLEREGTKVKVTLGTELTVSFVPELRELLCAIQEDGVLDLVLDFSKTMFLDTAGLSLLLAVRNGYSQEGRSFKLADMQLPVFSLLETLHLEKRLNAEIG